MLKTVQKEGLSLSLAMTIICMFVFTLPYRFPASLGLFGLFSWYIPVPVPPCLNDETWERCWEREGAGLSGPPGASAAFSDRSGSNQLI